MTKPSDLDVLGLTKPQHAVYASVLSRQRSDVGELVEHLSMSVETVRCALEVLRDRGFVTRAAQKLDTYQPVDPRDALGAGADQVAEAVARLRVRIPAYGARYDEVRRLAAAPGESGGGAAVLREPIEVAGWFARLQQRARSEFLVFDRPPYVSSPIETLQELTMRRGVAVRAIYVTESFERPGAWEEVLRLAALGEQCRTTPSLPLKMAISDRETVLVSLKVDGPSVEALLTSAAPIVEVMVGLFESYWARGVGLTPDSRCTSQNAVSQRSDNGALLREQDRHIMILIGSGATDEAIAARLGISARSVRRRTQFLMKQLGAESRFQFGVLASRAGWI